MENKTEYKPFEVDQHLTAHGNYWAERREALLHESPDKKKLLGSPCKACNKVFWPPRSVCTFCFGELKDMVEIGPLGTVETFTLVTYSEPIQPRTAPFIYAVIGSTAPTRAWPFPRRGRDRQGAHRHAGSTRIRKGPQGNILDIQYFKPL